MQMVWFAVALVCQYICRHNGLLLKLTDGCNESDGQDVHASEWSVQILLFFLNFVHDCIMPGALLWKLAVHPQA